jgi:[acyl-carrier-protein] S-malonyltransferase
LTGAARRNAEALADRRDAPFVATVGGRPIPVSRLDARLAEVRRGPRGRHLPPDGGSASVNVRRWIVQELVTEAILAQETATAGGDGEGDGSPAAGPSRAALARLVDRVASSVTVPESEIRGYYLRNPDLYRRPEVRRVRHILVADVRAAHDVVRRLEAGEAMEDVARAVSTDAGSRKQGGYLGDVRRGELSGPLEDALFAAEVGVFVGPCETEHGWHVARAEAVIAETTAPYPEVRGAIEAELLAVARARAFDEWLEERRRTLAIVEPEFAHPADPIHGVASHRH